DLGYIEGRNVAVERRDSDQYDRLPDLASELVRDQVTAIFADNLAAAVAARAATATIPIVFAVGGDPVRDGLVTSLSRPTGNLTGVTYFAGEVLSKRLELMRELVPPAEVMARSSTRTIRICRHDCEMRRRLHEKSGNKFSLSTPAVKGTSTWRLQPSFNSGRRRSLLATIRFLAAPPASKSWRWQRVTRFRQVIASVTWFGLAA